MVNRNKELISKKWVQPTDPEFIIEAQPEIFKGVYSNLAIISHAENEFVIDFLMRITGKTQLVSRVILSPQHAKLLLSALKENIKNFETSFGNIGKNKETVFKEIIIKAVHQAKFPYYKGLYEGLEDEITFEIEGREGKRYQIVAHYWSPDRGIHFPSEQVEKYFSRAKRSKIPYLVITNALGLTQEAREDLEEFNKKLKEEKLTFIFGSKENEFIEQLTKL